MNKKRIKAFRLLAISLASAMILNNSGMTVLATDSEDFFDHSDEIVSYTEGDCDEFEEEDVDEHFEDDTEADDEELGDDNQTDESIKDPSEFIDENTDHSEYLKYELDNKGNAIITGNYIYQDIDLIIPSKIDGHKVIGIGFSAFYNCDGLKSVKIPNSVKSIGEIAFYGCSGLTSITIPDSVTSIGENAFQNCSSLKRITIGNGLTCIGDYVFSFCNSLASVKISDSVTSIGYGAFCDCSSLKSITIPDSVKSIGELAFSSCSGLTSVTIGNGVTYIGNSAFFGCSSLKSIIIPNSVVRIGKYAFYDCSGLTSITIPDGVTSIAAGTFCQCRNLTNVTISNSVTSIESNAFYGCSGLTSITIPDSVTSIGEWTFSGCEKLTSVKIPNSVTSIADNAFDDCNNLTIYGISGSYAEQWAKSHGVKFVAIDSNNPDPVDPTYPVEVEYHGWKTSWDPSELSNSSFEGYNKKLAEICVFLCEAIYRKGQSDEDKKIFEQMGINGYKTVEDNSFVYSIAYDNMKIKGVDTNVVFIVLRGTDTWEERIKDAVSGYNTCVIDSKDYDIYNYCIDFSKKVVDSLNSLLKDHSEMIGKPTKFVVTGHSLGGAGSNFLAAVLMDNVGKTSFNYSKKDVYVYTYGAIDSIYANHLGSRGTVSEGYVNIHNIYNYHDTFGPNGWPIFTARGNSGYGKFGHLDLFDKNIKFFGIDNHMFGAYMPAVFNGEVKWYKPQRIVCICCPVDIKVYKDGKLVASVVNNVVDESVTTIPINVIDDEKHFLIDEESDYEFEITATANGEMLVDVSDAESGNDYKEFQSVKLTKNKTFISEIDSETENEDVILFVVDDSGKIVSEVQEDGEEITARVQVIFDDVDEGAWYVPYVQYVYDKDIMTGKGGTNGERLFDPNGKLTREQFTQVLYAYEGKPNVTNLSGFSDVNANAWYAKSIYWAKQKGITGGKPNGTFGVGENISRQDLAVMLYAYAKFKKFDLSKNDNALDNFNDKGKISSYAKEAMKWAVTQGVISGKGNGKVDPTGNATRAECATMIMKLIEKNK